MSSVWKWQLYIIFSIYGANTMSHPDIYKLQTFFKNLFVRPIYSITRFLLLHSFYILSVDASSSINKSFSQIIAIFILM